MVHHFAVVAVPGRIPLGLELPVVPVEAAVKFALVGLLALVLRSVDSFLPYQWSVNLAVAREEPCRRDQCFLSLLKSSHRLINLGCILLGPLWILMGMSRGAHPGEGGVAGVRRGVSPSAP